MSEWVGGSSGKTTQPVLFHTNQQSTVEEGREQLNNNTRQYPPARVTDGWDDNDVEGKCSSSSEGVEMSDDNKVKSGGISTRELGPWPTMTMITISPRCLFSWSVWMVDADYLT